MYINPIQMEQDDCPLLCSLVTFSSAHDVDTHLYCKTCDHLYQTKGSLSGFDNKCKNCTISVGN